MNMMRAMLTAVVAVFTRDNDATIDLFTHASMMLAALALCSALVASCKRSQGDDTAARRAPLAPATGVSSAAANPTMTSSRPPAPQTGEQDSDDARAMRARLVTQIQAFEKPWGDNAWDPRVMDAMLAVPRHLFMPGASIAQAYRDMPYPIGHGQTISQPTIVAMMTNALELSGSERVLEIGTGSGYQAAVLSLLVKELYSIEIVEPLGVMARDRLATLGYHNVTVRIGDGYAGWLEHAPFDCIILTAAPPEMPAALIAQLKDGGRIVAPVGTQQQLLVRWRKRGQSLAKETLGAVRFVPMVPGK
jgi:protein-L-isoaspartate(D-aspartate) O-methyltransferase